MILHGKRTTLGSTLTFQKKSDGTYKYKDGLHKY